MLTLGLLLADGADGAAVTYSLAITVEPTAGTTDVVLVPSFTVELRQDGVAAADTVTITASIASGTGTLGGTVAQSTGGGTSATFSDLKVATGTGAFTLLFTASGGSGAYGTVTSSAFSISAAPPTPAPGGRGRRRRVFLTASVI